jgi:WD40 repeat protein
MAMATSSDSHWLVTSSWDNTAYLWDLTAPDPAAAPILLRGHENLTTAVAISPDNHWLVTGSNDATVRLWDLTAPDPAAAPVHLHSHTDGIQAVAITPDNHWLVTGSLDNTVHLWTLQLDELIDLACSTTGRNFTQGEWEQFINPAPSSYSLTCPDLPPGEGVVESSSSH